VVPLWIAAGLADWFCHRRTRIERTSGLTENAFHWVLLAEGGIGLQQRREIRPFEQMVHSYMELLPLLLLVLLAVMDWNQVLALFDQATPDLSVRLKDQPWPPEYLLGAGLAALLLNVLPLAEETWRCLRRD